MVTQLFIPKTDYIFKKLFGSEAQVKEINEAREELARISRDPKEAEIYRQKQNAISNKCHFII
jgi:hypothetical protein